MNLPKPKLLLLFIAFLSSPIFLFSQTPPDTLSGEELRIWLKTNWYDGQHTTLGYSGVNGARSYMYNIIDNHNDTVTCVYSGHKEYRLYDLTRSAGTSGMTPINCEHSIPQSFFAGLEPMKSDIHHLYATYQNWNSTRSNHPFGEIDDAQTVKWMFLDSTQINIPDSDIDLWSEYAASVFEPREDHKGNLARSIFYFYTMYPTEAGVMSNLGDSITFYNWHLSDPPNPLEYQRDDDIYIYQGNANPYLTNPGLISRVFNLGNLPPPNLNLSASVTELTISWGDMPAETGYKIFRSTDNISFAQIGGLIDMDSVSYIDDSALHGNTYYYYVTSGYATGGSSPPSDTISGMLLPPSPPSAVADLVLIEKNNSLDLNWTDVASEESYQIYRSINNVDFNALGSPLNANTTSYSDNTAAPSTTYYYYIVAINSFGSSDNSNTVSGELLSYPRFASELLISEYIEGSSFNKAIEITNYTGASIDLSNYKLGKQANGSGTWDLFGLSGTLADATTYVIVHSSAAATLLAKADLTVNNTVINFNGNDPVALIKGSTIIDIVGVENGGSANFAKDVTLVRNSNITEPNSTYTISEWSSYAQDYFDNIGVHIMDLGGTLPVELVSFDGFIFPAFNKLEWVTSSELNSDFFEIQMSENGNDFKSIGKVNAMGNSSYTKRYEFIDNQPLKSAYYRLRQVDKDGTFEFSEVIHLSRIIETNSISLAPNPADKFIYLTIEMKDQEDIQIDVYSITGQLVFQKRFDLSEGVHIYEIPIHTFEDGVYFLEMNSQMNQIRKKFVKIEK